MNRAALAHIYSAPSCITERELLKAVDEFAARAEAATREDGATPRNLPLTPWGGSISDLHPKYRPNTDSSRDPAEARSTRWLTAGSDIGLAITERSMSLPDAGSTAEQEQSVSASKTKYGGKEPPPFPGSDGSLGDYVVWTQFWANVGPKRPKRPKNPSKPDGEQESIPVQDLSFEQVRDYVRDFLIQKGVKYASEQIKKLMADGLASLLEREMADAMSMASSEAKKSGFDKLLTEVNAFIDDPGKYLSNQFFERLPQLGDMGMEALFKEYWDADKEGSAANYLINLHAKKLVKEIVDNLLAGAKSLDDLLNNFDNYLDNLYKKIDEFFNGRPFKPGSAYLPVARVADKDDLVDQLVTGLESVIVEGQPISRVTDLLFPSGKPLSVGSQIVTAGGLPVGRTTSQTAIPSQIAPRPATVLVEGRTFAGGEPGGGLYTPVDPLTGGMTPTSPSSSASLNQCSIYKGNSLTVMIGGAGDSSFDWLYPGPVQDILLPQAQVRNPDSDYLYFTWTDQEAAAQAIRDYHTMYPDSPITVVGHSYGADSAVDIADLLADADSNIRIENLYTLDGASLIDADRLLGDTRPDNIVRWTNVYSQGTSFPDLIATLGGHWGGEMKADLNIEVTRSPASNSSPTGTGTKDDPIVVHNPDISHADAYGYYEAAERERRRRQRSE